MNIAARLAAPTDTGLMGPNAVLQLLPIMNDMLGRRETQRLMMTAGMVNPPGNEGLMPEAPAAALHQLLRREYPEQAPALLWSAGGCTADYVMAHRIPGPAKLLLKALPGALAGPMLIKSIADHAWTFAGSGSFTVVRTHPITVSLHNNPLICGERATTPLCIWHQAVFERLFAALVDREARCVETACQAMGDPACRFEVSW